MKDRIKAIMDSKRMNNKLFAQLTGINEGTLSLILRGKAQPTLKTYDAIHKHFPDISMEWLFDGEGPMYKKDEVAHYSDLASSSGAGDASTGGSAISPDVFPTSADSSTTAVNSNGSAPSLFSGNGQQQSDVISQIGKSVEKAVVKYVDKPQRKITEIRVFFDDQTWESFVPKNK